MKRTSVQFTSEKVNIQEEEGYRRHRFFCFSGVSACIVCLHWRFLFCLVLFLFLLLFLVWLAFWVGFNANISVVVAA
jgi:hypothetical protein